MFVIRDEASLSPSGYDGIHYAGWRVRPDNLWAQGPMDNIVGMQYRIDHLENLKADVFDQIAQPIIKIKGDDVIEPEEGYAPGAVYYCGLEGDVEILKPDTTALNADTQIQIYHRMMEEFAGAPPETRGVRTPGEKTAFEVEKLDANATVLFVDKARNFELMLETVLKEAFELMMINFDDMDYVSVTNDITGKDDIKQLSFEDVKARGRFTAQGARLWSRRNRETLELSNFMGGPMKDPGVRRHISGENLTKFFTGKLDLQDQNIFQPFAGVKEDAQAQAVAQSELQSLEQESGAAPQGDDPNAAGLAQAIPPGPGGPAGGPPGS
tara:strand:- start:3127 stop:4101 length:975 start_codon:yes stop_codon:yes gene_type:complete